MASGINGTMRQVGVALGFAGLGAILAHRTGISFVAAAKQLGLPADQLNDLSRSVIRGDFVGASVTVPAGLQSAFHTAADASMFEGFRILIAVAAVVALLGAAATFFLVRPIPADR